MLNHLPEKIRLALAITPGSSVYWKNGKGEPPQRVTAPGGTSVGQMLKTNLPYTPYHQKDRHAFIVPPKHGLMEQPCDLLPFIQGLK